MLYVMLFTSVQFSITQLNNEIKNSPPDGAWSLQFQITNNLNLGVFQGLMFSGKRQISDNSAIRLGIGMNFQQTEAEWFVDEKMDLLAKIGLNFSKRFVDEESIDQYSFSKSNSKSTNGMTSFIQPGTGELAVSLYF